MADQPRTWRRHAAPAAVFAVGALAAIAWGWHTVREARALTRLPQPPAGVTRAVATHLAERAAAARRAPTDIRAVGPLCTAFHADMLFVEADACYARAAELAPGEWRWVYARALLEADRGGSAELVARLRHVVAREPGFGPAWLRLGDAEFKAGRRQEAAEAWRRAQQAKEPARDGTPPHVVETPLAGYATLGLARLALVAGDAAGAATTLEALVAASPQLGVAWRLLADAYRTTGRDADAARAVARASRLPEFAPYPDPVVDTLARESRNATLLLRLASEASLAANAAWSEWLTRRALEFEPDNPEVVAKMARLMRTFDRNGEALGYFQRYRELVPGDVQVLAQLATCLSALGRWDEAEEHFRQAFAAGVDDPLTHFNHGLLFARTGRVDLAEQAYLRALARDPNAADARLNLAILFARRGQVPRAAAELERLLADQPEHALAHANLGLIRMQQGRRSDAVRELETAVRLEPGLSQAAEALQTLR